MSPERLSFLYGETNFVKYGTLQPRNNNNSFKKKQFPK